MKTVYEQIKSDYENQFKGLNIDDAVMFCTNGIRERRIGKFEHLNKNKAVMQEFNENALAWEIRGHKEVLVYMKDETVKLDINFIMTRSALIALGETKEDVNKKLNKNSIYL